LEFEHERVKMKGEKDLDQNLSGAASICEVGKVGENWKVQWRVTDHKGSTESLASKRPFHNQLAQKCSLAGRGVKPATWGYPWYPSQGGLLRWGCRRTDQEFWAEGGGFPQAIVQQA